MDDPLPNYTRVSFDIIFYLRHCVGDQVVSLCTVFLVVAVLTFAAGRRTSAGFLAVASPTCRGESVPYACARTSSRRATPRRCLRRVSGCMRSSGRWLSGTTSHPSSLGWSGSANRSRRARLEWTLSWCVLGVESDSGGGECHACIFFARMCVLPCVLLSCVVVGALLVVGRGTPPLLLVFIAFILLLSSCHESTSNRSCSASGGALLHTSSRRHHHRLLLQPLRRAAGGPTSSSSHAQIPRLLLLLVRAWRGLLLRRRARLLCSPWRSGGGRPPWRRRRRRPTSRGAAANATSPRRRLALPLGPAALGVVLPGLPPRLPSPAPRGARALRPPPPARLLLRLPALPRRLRRAQRRLALVQRVRQVLRQPAPEALHLGRDGLPHVPARDAPGGRGGEMGRVRRRPAPHSCRLAAGGSGRARLRGRGCDGGVAP